MRLRVVTFNVHGLRSGVDAVAGALSRVRPDIVLVQECGSRRRLGHLAAALGMEVASSHRPFNRVRNAVLFALPLRGVERVVRDLPRQDRASRRGFVQVALAAHGVRLTVVSVHLGLSPRERVHHAAELMEHLEALAPPVIVGADLNEGPGGPAAQRMSTSLVDAYEAVGEPPGLTYPAKRPTDRIDYVLVSHDLRIGGAWVGSGPDGPTASDHLPVVVDLELRA